MSGDERCEAPTKEDGSPCPTPVALCSECGRCRSHCDYSEACDYDEEEVRESRSRGAKAANAQARDSKIRTVETDEAPPPPESAEEASRWLSWSIWAVSTGRIDARTAHEIAYSCRAFLKALDKAEVDQRVEQLQRVLAAKQEGKSVKVVRTPDGEVDEFLIGS